MPTALKLPIREGARGFPWRRDHRSGVAKGTFHMHSKSDTPLVEPLEDRVFMDANPGPGRPPVLVPTNVALPLHVTMARDLVAHVAPENNLYDTPTVLQWAGVDGQTVYKNTSVCSTLITKLTMRAYGFRSTDFTRWTGETS